MGRYILRRSMQAVLVLLGVVTFVFVAGRMIGDPATLLLGAGATAEDLEGMREAMGLADPLVEQYGRFLWGAVQGDFGVTFRHGFSYAASAVAVEGQSTLPIVLSRLPASFLLAGLAIGLAVAIAIPIGIVAAVWPRSIFDRVVNVVSLGGVSVVEFWLGFLLILLFAQRLGWLPTSGGGGFRFAILPALALAVRPIGRLTQIVRSAMLDELAKPYVVAARAKGIPESRVVVRHALKNSSIPIVTMVGDETTNLLTGMIPVELVFAWPGVGLLLVDALGRRDLPLIEATVFLFAVMVVIVNLLLDLTYTRLDPKVRFS